MRNIFFPLLTMFILGCINQSFSQQTTPNNLGSVKGVLRDTTNNYHLKSATVSLFKADSTLLSYQLSNNYGEFSFGKLPLNSKMYIEVSHLGYHLFRKNFVITDVKAPLDLKTLIIATKDFSLKEVQIKIPPISMNGDTLEFNAAAFKLDSNAVVEDLLRKIPNITLWGDGQITVNGREVKSILVNGKPFFGGDFKTATQNISKNALEKVQVYNTIKDRSNPLDSTLEMNLKLKKGKDIGYFGKVGGGMGTDRRFEGDASINMFSPKVQAAIIGASNNINKVANSVGALTANSTFKGVGTNVEYQPDFRQTGINKTFTGGVNLTYNFVVTPDYNNRNTLTANYFEQRKFYDNLEDRETIITRNTNDKLFDRSISKSESNNDNHAFDATYTLNKKGSQLSVTPSFNFNKGDNSSTSERSTFNNENKLASTNVSSNNGELDNKRFNVVARYNFRPTVIYSDRRMFQGLNINYSMGVQDNNSERYNITKFRSEIDAAQNRDFNRKYTTQSDNLNQRIDFELPGLTAWLFGYNSTKIVNVDVFNNFSNSANKTNSKVEDLIVGTNSYKPNDSLTNFNQTNQIDDNFGINLSKSFNKSLSNRFNKGLTFRATLANRLIYQDNKSDRSFQNIKRNYTNFIPSASISHNNNQYGEFYRSISISYNTDISIPNLQQLAPIIDDSNVYSISYGNLNLKEAIVRSIRFNLSHNTQKSKNNLNINLSGAYSTTDDNVIDSLFIDEQNKRVNYLVNGDGTKSYNGNLNIRKAYKLKTSELQLTAYSSFNASKNPGYFNSVFLYSDNLNNSNSLSVNYTYRDKWALEGAQSFNYSQSKQASFNTEYDTKTWTSAVSTRYNVTKRFSINSNISFNSNKASNNEAVNFKIWNANVTYRFLKGNNAEFKFAALDILRQNNNIINYTGINSVTRGTQKVLQQYFMTTFSYYPRKFGKDAPKK
ncbi:TonB-dependent receptor [Pedobacter frigoris]|uniref:TonB-dependent receptor n=1 Tax=Pedobacter frigoris TaxID=2571272 RepID=UPI00292CB33D|nr:TonB-dependent receptor [Pedobacter frigoris]